MMGKVSSLKTFFRGKKPAKKLLLPMEFLALTEHKHNNYLSKLANVAKYISPSRQASRLAW